MKTNYTHKLALSAALCLLSLFTVPVQAASPIDDDSLVRTSKNTNDDEEPAESKKNATSKTTTFATRNNELVSIYPDIIKRAMHVSVKKIKAAKINMDIFDISGNIVKKYELKAKGHVKINGLNPGKYTYLILIENKEALKGLFEIK